jgi:uncharacterized protein with FMN-binding domain
MKKILLSLAVIAASGAYVAYENPFNAKAGIGANASADGLPLAVKPADIILPASLGVAKPVVAQSQPLPAPIVPAAPVSSIDVPTQLPTPAFGKVQVPVTPLPAPVRVAELPAKPAHNPGVSIVDTSSSTRPLQLQRPASAPAAVEVAQAAATQAAYRDGTFKGTSANAYYGRVQVDAVIRGGQLVSVKVLSYPNDRRTSRNINSFALPQLEQEALQAQSANIDGVSGATLTSGAYEQSLDAALSAARTGGNNA